MKTRPIIFDAESVRGLIIAYEQGPDAPGAKTMTRRPIKPQPPPTAQMELMRHGNIIEAVSVMPDGTRGHGWKSPHGIPGDQGWVRETYPHSGNPWTCIYGLKVLEVRG